MALLDRIPGELSLFIGGLFTLRRRESLQASDITHVLSILRQPLDQQLFEGFTHKVVEVDDVDDENLLEHFPACNKFVQDGLDAGGGVLVHCLLFEQVNLRNTTSAALMAGARSNSSLRHYLDSAMGKSRSATVMCAFLMQRYGITPGEALSQIREARPLCEPNEAFWKQLEIYHEIATPENVEESPTYQRWLYQREVELSRACGQAPEAEKIRFEDEHVQQQTAADFELRCRKCRRPLATSQYLVKHQARQHGTASSCAHYFLDPLSWMRLELEKGKLDGRLECPKCKANVGKYAWQGMQCSCGDWAVPGISLAKGKVDEVKSRPQGATGMGIRMPPQVAGRRSGSGQENL